jgi:integrase
MAWRTGAEGGPCLANTARLELKLWSFVMAEAARREFTESNPLALAKVPRAPAPPKKELTPADFAAARRAFAARKTAPWMLTAFEICAHLGCRFSEADLGREDVDFATGLVWVTDAKRAVTDPRKRFAVPMPLPLQKTLKRALRSRERTTPKLVGEQNRQFNRTLKAATGATSHSLRVSFITRCHRAGLSESQAMRLVNHSSRLVHAVYSKLGVGDAREAAARVPAP